MDAEVRVLLVDGERWFIGIDVLKYVGYTQSITTINQAVISKLGAQHSSTTVIKDGLNRNRTSVILSEKALKYTLQQSRKPKAKELAMKLDLELDIMQSPVETETIRIIQAAFAHLNPIDQFFVAGYRIDLYFPKEKIAIECDEAHHITPSQAAKDDERCAVITDLLGCSWVRYSPNTPGFNIGQVINQIIVRLAN